MVLRRIRDLPGVPSLLATVTGGIIIRRLDLSVGRPGPRDLAVRLGSLRLATQSGHRIPRPTSVTIAKRPSCGRGTAWTMQVNRGSDKAKYFSRGGLDAISENQGVGQISWRRPLHRNRPGLNMHRTIAYGVVLWCLLSKVARCSRWQAASLP